MRTAVYGGTFDPIHRGHLHILEEFMGRLGLERALLIPAGLPPHKQVRHLARPEERAAMCEIAAQSLPGQVEVCRMELERPGKSFTADTLAALEVLYPADTFYLLMGEDMFLTVDRWHDAGGIFRRAVLCASPRSGEGLARLRHKQRELEKLGARCAVEDIPFWDISSTSVRALAREGADIAALVPAGVADYIAAHRLYGAGPDQVKGRRMD
ncbi:nicotinate-nucleotide adenylyltransferase [Acutalibacter caecimuris]|uniref:nicotinate-nucleotide adenylyltransferase n=1 Tax=Acutalibacter caecimuris TaxID=3093657 RepID=UPI002AC9D99D|nr:nicotinate-nucleotide adenylyltransferase [Acutalibacter sp. M00118]